MPLIMTDKVKLWYSEPIEKIRIASEPGGDALSLDEAKRLHEQLGELIDKAEQRD